MKSHIIKVAMALPENMMSLSTIMLKMEFMGWLYKLCISFLGYMNSLHKIGAHNIITYILLRLSSKNYSSHEHIENNMKKEDY